MLCGVGRSGFEGVVGWLGGMLAGGERKGEADESVELYPWGLVLISGFYLVLASR
jgi:hypothetical protein